MECSDEAAFLRKLRKWTGNPSAVPSRLQDLRGRPTLLRRRGGELHTLVRDNLIGRSVDPIEKRPLFHIYPSATAYSITAVGCNLRCSFCQN
jgi:hypothetical protein